MLLAKIRTTCTLDICALFLLYRFLSFAARKIRLHGMKDIPNYSFQAENAVHKTLPIAFLFPTAFQYMLRSSELFHP
ncbi:hypothetical protein COU12_01170 [Candidatus Jorgensenbacteria bacterium CG10_big_fil_rev_8_21_14_0_10_54_38]|uniref:Uncharacterized protein n=2 Tax=Candidatus Joergenseniibacteriota TaxID=1752739 RepID=A0A2M6WG75_9BACT|nr:MAG: hypothetical protein COX26_02605 [Candidatus Jorgensenbacteria bacterium CG23_combo_of_CG06-09_8_20_14_all_54_14]PIT91810.1 MAG: hypothetical protein COU12_01170 [Candidatus Jorgensenbacteria bacterium CG10_big_fil_rev_8_21_14_0_10_54_38]